jgi:hypothetical protein
VQYTVPRSSRCGTDAVESAREGTREGTGYRHPVEKLSSIPRAGRGRWGGQRPTQGLKGDQATDDDHCT